MITNDSRCLADSLWMRRTTRELGGQVSGKGKDHVSYVAISCNMLRFGLWMRTERLHIYFVAGLSGLKVMT
jgi:hypothetical protein